MRRGGELKHASKAPHLHFKVRLLSDDMVTSVVFNSYSFLWSLWFAKSVQFNVIDDDSDSVGSQKIFEQLIFHFSL